MGPGHLAADGFLHLPRPAPKPEAALPAPVAASPFLSGGNDEPLSAPSSTTAPGLGTGERAVADSPMRRRDGRGPGPAVPILRLVAAVAILASLSMLAASAGIGLTGELSGAFALATGGFAVIVLIASVATFVLAGWPPGLLINEGDAVSSPAEEPMPLGGWLRLMLLTLMALPAWMVARLSPLVALWQDMLLFLDEHRVWRWRRRQRSCRVSCSFPCSASCRHQRSNSRRPPPSSWARWA
jgi:hypothetical protein